MVFRKLTDCNTHPVPVWEPSETTLASIFL